MTPAVRNTQFNTATSGTSVTITKPTGLVAGDFLVAYLSFTAGGSGSITVPTGWTSQGVVNMDDDFRQYGVLTKIADAGDISASDFTFSISRSINTLIGQLVAIQNVPQTSTVRTFAISANAPNTTALSFTASATPLTINSLLLIGFAARSGGSGSDTIGSYASTPSNTFTELADNVVSSSVQSIASATLTSLSEITAYSATISNIKVFHAGSILVITAPQNASAEVAHLDSLPTINGVVATNNVVIDGVSHLAIVPTLNGVSSRTNNPIWTPQVKTATTWTPEIK